MKEPPSIASSKKGGATRRLRTVENVRRCVADVMRAVEASGDIGEPDRARVMIAAAKVMSELITGSAFERRLRVLEAQRGVDDSGAAAH